MNLQSMMPFAALCLSFNDCDVLDQLDWCPAGFLVSYHFFPMQGEKPWSLRLVIYDWVQASSIPGTLKEQELSGPKRQNFFQASALFISPQHPFHFFMYGNAINVRFDGFTMQHIDAAIGT